MGKAVEEMERWPGRAIDEMIDIEKQGGFRIELRG